MQLAANATATLTVDERQQTVRAVDWLDPLADDAVQAYLRRPEGRSRARQGAHGRVGDPQGVLVAPIDDGA